MAQRLRIGVLAGEASGDLLGSRVIAALRTHFDEVIVEGIGGPQLRSQGLNSLFPMERLSVMGLVEPLLRLPELLRIRGAVYRYFHDNPPDLFLAIDSPDFNLHLERKLRKAGVPTIHLVSPSVWAWRQWRIRKIRQAVDLMLCLFPFETAIYDKHRIPARYVGHPLADEITERVDSSASRVELGLTQTGKLLALLPGSREAEVRLLAPLFLETARRLLREDPGLSFIVPAANEQRYKELQRQLQAYPELPLTLLRGRATEAMSAADVVLLASGTATLEAALLRRPMVVSYRMGALSWALISRLVHTRHAALPNVLAGETVVPELLQAAATPEALVSALRPLLAAEDVARRQCDALDTIHVQLRRDFAATAASALVELAAARLKVQ